MQVAAWNETATRIATGATNPSTTALVQSVQVRPRRRRLRSLARGRHQTAAVSLRRAASTGAYPPAMGRRMTTSSASSGSSRTTSAVPSARTVVASIP